MMLVAKYFLPPNIVNIQVLKFTKMQGAGNDYIYVDCTVEPIDNAEAVARFVSDRHFGIGSDGLVLIKKSDRADFFMAMYNADGSQAQQSDALPNMYMTTG